MNNAVCLLCLTLACQLYMTRSQLIIHPEQVHLSFSGVPSEMVVSWVTQNYTSPSVVEYGRRPFEDNATSPGPTQFIDKGPEGRSIWIHRVVMTNLIPRQQYIYHVGGGRGWSDAFWFKARTAGRDWSPRFVIYGDLGNKNAASLADLQEGAQKGHFDAVLHIGDFAYDMHDNNGRVGDEFMRQIEPIAAYVPYMTCPGNHEAYYFDLGPVHFISINTEVFYQKESQTTENIIRQYNWLLNDLEHVNQPEVRATFPWIVVLGHRPMYCSNEDDQCNTMFNPVREGLHPGSRSYSLEDLFYKYGVDLQFYAHEHSYERLWPVYKGKVCNGSRSAYDNPGAPVHIVTGSPGCQEIHTQFDPVVFPWSAFHSKDYGYSRMQVLNTTHLYLEQVSIDQGGAVIDKMTLVKNKHGRGSFNCHA